MATPPVTLTPSFLNAVRSVAPFMSKDKNLPLLTGVWLDPDGFAYATDRYRAARSPHGMTLDKQVWLGADMVKTLVAASTRSASLEVLDETGLVKVWWSTNSGSASTEQNPEPPGTTPDVASLYRRHTPGEFTFFAVNMELLKALPKVPGMQVTLGWGGTASRKTTTLLITTPFIEGFEALVMGLHGEGWVVE